MFGQAQGEPYTLYRNDSWARSTGNPAPYKLCNSSECLSVSEKEVARLIGKQR